MGDSAHNFLKGKIAPVTVGTILNYSNHEKSKKQLANKGIVITGAASRIEAESARFIKAHGAFVIGVNLKEPKENVDQFISII